MIVKAGVDRKRG